MDNANDTANNQISTPSTPSNSNKYWCFMCEKEFSQATTDSTEVFCPTCNCISELIDTENDPRTFKPYDAQNEANPPSNANTNSTINANVSNTQSNPIQRNTQMQQSPVVVGFNMVSQVIQGPLGRVVIQTMAPSGIAPLNQNVGINQPQAQPQTQPQAQSQAQPQAQPQSQQPQGQPSIGNIIGGFLGNNPFAGLLNPMFGGFGGQGDNIFADLESRIIEEFLRNDPNRHGPPPASLESINRLKKVKYAEGVSKTRDCSVCQEDFKNGEYLVKMPCEHCFHKDCVTKWLSMHNSCPVCRKALNEPEPTVPDYIS